MTTIRDLTYDLLRQRGITTISGNPGSNELPFLEDFPSDFRYILALRGGTTIGMADGCAPATGRIAFVDFHSAAGTSNAIGGCANALSAYTPLVKWSRGRPRCRRDDGARRAARSQRQAGHRLRAGHGCSTGEHPFGAPRRAAEGAGVGRHR